jgi:hypothetical protein
MGIVVVMYMFNLIRSCLAIFWSGFTILHSCYDFLKKKKNQLSNFNL